MEFIDIAVFYDIRDDKRRYRFSEFLKNLGLERVQMSGFVGSIRKDLLEKLVKECSKPKFLDDKIHVILLYKCKKKSVLSFGEAWIPKDEDFISV